MIYFLLTILIDISVTMLVIWKVCGRDLWIDNKRKTAGRKKIQAMAIPGGIKFSHNPGLSVASQSGTFPGLSAYADQEDFCHILINYYQQLSRLTVGNLFLDRPNASTEEQLTLEQAILQALEVNQLVQELSGSNFLISPFLIHKPALFSSNSRLAGHLYSIQSDTERHIQMLRGIVQAVTQDLRTYQQVIGENNRIMAEYSCELGKTFSACKKETVFFTAMVSEYFILE